MTIRECPVCFQDLDNQGHQDGCPGDDASDLKKVSFWSKRGYAEFLESRGYDKNGNILPTDKEG